ncbi:hypothetical protein [Burkholderia vietnamiensis]|uniref:hypothetical protein n=1 Tax=Burkholderia vietnamiensis TaxID=60552 RepID=UPI001594E5B4|nr:hypothetical protein [Burkholderia vietnamiensis]
MAETTLDKVKEQCLELVMNIIPMSQIGFVFVTAVVVQRMSEHHGRSTFDALANIGIKNMFGPDSGMFWTVDIIKIGACFFLALLNTRVIKAALRHSFKSSRISGKIEHWIAAATGAIKDLDKEERAPLRESITAELDKRLRRYHAKRLLCEALFSIPAVIVYTSFYLAILGDFDASKLEISWVESIVGVISAILCFLSHRESVRYALAKIIPLQVYLTATTGQVAFFIDED